MFSFPQNKHISFIATYGIISMKIIHIFLFV